MFLSLMERVEFSSDLGCSVWLSAVTLVGRASGAVRCLRSRTTQVLVSSMHPARKEETGTALKQIPVSFPNKVQSKACAWFFNRHLAWSLRINLVALYRGACVSRKAWSVSDVLCVI